uniref:Zinc finger protein interacting with ribonucleoprotein K-like n=1 Tax=Erpetoichthys calabaricus TaxID=27687 RepID=A0A8C4XBU9_ERPCA
MEKQSLDVKEEGGEEESVQLKKKNLDIKEEKCEWWTIGVKEELESKCGSTKTQKSESVSNIKEEDLKPESASQYECPDEAVPGLGFTPCGPLSPPQNHSVHVKSESSELCLKRPQKESCSSYSGKGSGDLQPISTESDGKQGPNLMELLALGQFRLNSLPNLLDSDLPESGSFSLSSVPQTSANLRLQQTPHNDNMKKPASGTEPLISDIFQCGALPVEKQTRVDAINSQKQIQNTNSVALSVCPAQGAVFTCITKYKDIWSQMTQKPYYCSECGKQFLQMSRLRSHARIHTGEKPFFCSDCGKRFLRISSLQRHKMIHTGEKPFFCSDCGKRFTTSGCLKIHTRIHTGEKPYCCSDCGKQFTTSGCLQTHTRIHTGEKPYCCSECGRQFSRKSSLRRHTSIHTGENNS